MHAQIYKAQSLVPLQVSSQETLKEAGSEVSQCDEG